MKHEKLKWHNETRKVNDLIPYEQNPRKLTDKQAKTIQESLEKFDLVEIPAINLDNKIIAGHQRMKLMQLLGRGEEEVDVRVPNRMLTQAEFKEYMVRSNQNRGEWDYDLLSGLFTEEELIGIGFSERELDMVSFGELEDISIGADAEDTEMKKYELVFATSEDYKTFTSLLKKIKGEDETISESLLTFLKDNVPV